MRLDPQRVLRDVIDAAPSSSKLTAPLDHANAAATLAHRYTVAELTDALFAFDQLPEPRGIEVDDQRARHLNRRMREFISDAVDVALDYDQNRISAQQDAERVVAQTSAAFRRSRPHAVRELLANELRLHLDVEPTRIDISERGRA